MILNHYKFKIYNYYMNNELYYILIIILLYNLINKLKIN